MILRTLLFRSVTNPRSYITTTQPSRNLRQYLLGPELVGKTEVFFAIGVTVAAVYVAYTCNKRSGKFNPVMMGMVAALFPEIYLVQSTARNLVGDQYKCSKR